MGRGGCEFAEAGFGMIRGILGCLCCLCICGPLLFIIGIVMVVSPNYYKENTDKYNAAVTSFNSNEKSIMLGSTGSMNNNISLTSQSTTHPISSASTLPSGENINSAEATAVLLSTSSQTTIPASGTITDTGSRSSSITTSSHNVGGMTTYSGNIRCPGSSSSSGSRSSSSTRYCSNSQLTDICRQQTNCNHATWTSTFQCEEGESCSGTCRYNAVQSAQCNVLAHSNASGFSLSTKYSSCLYPFTQSDQPKKCASTTSSSSSSSSSNNVTMTVMFMSAADPFIAAQEITESQSMSFGITEAQQRTTGLVLMLIGGLGIGMVVGVAIVVKKNFCKDDESKRKMYGAFGQSYNGEPVYVVQQQQQNYSYGNQQSPIMMMNNGNPNDYNNNYTNQNGYSSHYGGQQQQPQQHGGILQQPVVYNQYQQQQPGYAPPPPNAAYGVPVQQQQQQQNPYGQQYQQQQKPQPAYF